MYSRVLMLSALLVAMGIVPGLASPAAGAELRDSPACTQVAGCYTKPPGMEARELPTSTGTIPTSSPPPGRGGGGGFDARAADANPTSSPPSGRGGGGGFDARAAGADPTTLDTVFV